MTLNAWVHVYGDLQEQLDWVACGHPQFSRGSAYERGCALIEWLSFPLAAAPVVPWAPLELAGT